MTLTPRWQARSNGSGMVPEPRMDLPVDPALIAALTERIPDFRRACEPDGLAPEEFDTNGARVRTLRAFIGFHHDLLAAVRDQVLPNPAVRTTDRLPMGR